MNPKSIVSPPCHLAEVAWLRPRQRPDKRDPAPNPGVRKKFGVGIGIKLVDSCVSQCAGADSRKPGAQKNPRRKRGRGPCIVESKNSRLRRSPSVRSSTALLGPNGTTGPRCKAEVVNQSDAGPDRGETVQRWNSCLGKNCSIKGFQNNTPQNAPYTLSLQKTRYENKNRKGFL